MAADGQSFALSYSAPRRGRPPPRQRHGWLDSSKRIAKNIYNARECYNIMINKVEAVAIAHKGFETVCESEIVELIKAKKCVVGDTTVLFEAKDTKEIAELCYKAQSVSRIILVISKFEHNGKKGNEFLELLKDSINAADFGAWLKDRTFRVNCEHTIELEATSVDIAEQAGEYIIDKTKAKAKMNDPDIIVFVYVNDKTCFVGIDFSGFDLSKRDYKIYVMASSMNGALAYSFIRAAGFKKDSVLLDPFCGSGIIPIEAALYSSGKSPNFYRKDKFAFHKFMKIDLDKFDNEKKEIEAQIFGSDFILSAVKATRNNAKIAGIEKTLNMTKIEVEWLDTKYDEKFFDFIVTQPPIDSKQTDVKQIEKAHKELFNHAEYILKDKGRLAVIMQKTDIFRRCMYNFEITEEYSVWQGKQELTVMVLKKSKK